MASIKYRWNVSGTYMQVVPRFLSTAADGQSDEREFLADCFDSPGEMNSNVFLKGYQWPFDSRKVAGGSSMVDILVYIETVLKGRRVFLDYRSNPRHFRFEDLSSEALDYLTNSGALQETPIQRLRKMNPGAIEIYAKHGIDIAAEPLEIAVCAQHNNGGLAGNHWWESVNVKHLFPVGEVNGSHGVYRPGGASLNAGQVGSFRAAEFIANRYQGRELSEGSLRSAAVEAVAGQLVWIEKCATAEPSWQAERDEFQRRMSRAGAHIRSAKELKTAVAEAREQCRRMETSGCGCSDPGGLVEALRNRSLCFAHAVYLEAVLFAVESGVGSRGSAITLADEGTVIHEKLGDQWRSLPENTAYRKKVLETRVLAEGRVDNRWVDQRPIPQTDVWFETAWARFRSGEIYG
jgi:succinate dehydrogenase/fumarate reductase flavoprotein subunit